MKLNISPLNETDFPVLIGWAEDEKTLLQWAGPYFKFPLTIGQLKDYLAPALLDNPVRYIFKSADENGIITGMTELNPVDRVHKSAGLCRIFTDKSYRGKGVADYMIKYALNFGFGELGLNRIDLRVYTFNSAAIKCYEGIGFVKEGSMRSVTKYKNEYWDGLIYSMLKSEWEDKKFR